MLIGDRFLATRTALTILRSARAGHAPAQLTLGRRYLFGEQGLPRNPASALYWLDRAASQQEPDAWLLIGRHVPFDVARALAPAESLAQWYERAYDSGVAQAGLVFAQLVFGASENSVGHDLQHKALIALTNAAQAGIAEAQWYLAQRLGDKDDPSALENNTVMYWMQRAAHGGIADARRALREHAWAEEDGEEFIFWALPDARACVARYDARRSAGQRCSAEERVVLSRCAGYLLDQERDCAEGLKMLKIAAQENDQTAQFYLGLWLARLDENGARCAHSRGLAQYKKAIYWLTRAAQQAHAGAWFILSCLYRKRACSLRDANAAQHCLQRAAHAGHAQAQYEIGLLKWRQRSTCTDADVEASQWLLKAAYQGHAAAQTLLNEMRCQQSTADWLPANLRTQLKLQLQRNQPSICQTALACPFMAARLALAQAFGLSMAEALMIDPVKANRSHCLCIDIRAQRPRVPRRLVLIETDAQRQALEQCQRVFNMPEMELANLEGSYRQRAYRLRAQLQKTHTHKIT